MSRVTALRETAVEDSSWGQIIDRLLLEAQVGAGVVIHYVAVNFNTPSSASQPLLEVTIDDTPRNRQLLAAALYSEVDELEWLTPVDMA